MLLKNKTIIVTGGAGAIGRVFCTAISEQGGNVIIADVDLQSATLLAQKLSNDLTTSNNKHASVIAAPLDITNLNSINDILNEVHNKFGNIHAVVNNAYPRNCNYGRKLEDVTYDDFCDNVSMHLGGYFLVAQRFGMYFSKQGFGNIINMASIYGVIPPRFSVYSETSMTMPVEYAAIKSAIIHLTRYFSQYYKKQGIRVNSISPGGILSNQNCKFVERYNSHCMSKGMLSPDDLVGALLFLLSDQSQFMTGQNLIVDDGYTL